MHKFYKLNIANSYRSININDYNIHLEQYLDELTNFGSFSCKFYRIQNSFRFYICR